MSTSIEKNINNLINNLSSYPDNPSEFRSWLFAELMKPFTNLLIKRLNNIYSTFSININDIISVNKNQDFKVFREFPLIRTGSDSLIVINPVFLFDRFWNSIRFDYKSLFDNLSDEEKNNLNLASQRVDINTIFTKEFSEHHLFSSTISRIFSKTECLKLSGEECEAIHADRAPDYYIKDNNIIYLFEYKDILINAKTKESFSSSEIKRFIETRFVKKDSNQASAVKQLANGICMIYKKIFFWDKNIDIEKCYINPIIVVNDPMFTSLGFSNILNDYFQKELDALKISSCFREKINRLLICNIDNLLMLKRDLIRDGVNSNICDYNSYLRKDILCNESEKVSYDSVFHSLYSFSEFLDKKYLNDKTILDYYSILNDL